MYYQLDWLIYTDQAEESPSEQEEKDKINESLDDDIQVQFFVYKNANTEERHLIFVWQFFKDHFDIYYLTSEEEISWEQSVGEEFLKKLKNKEKNERELEKIKLLMCWVANQKIIEQITLQDQDIKEDLFYALPLLTSGSKLIGLKIILALLDFSFPQESRYLHENSLKRLTDSLSKNRHIQNSATEILIEYWSKKTIRLIIQLII